jgi:glycine dehydrogenase subunit 1
VQVNLDQTALVVKDVNKALLKYQIHGGKDLSKEFPELGRTALCCVTEIHSMKEIDRLAEALAEILGGR